MNKNKKLYNLIESINNCIDKEYYYLTESEKRDLLNEVIYNALIEAIDLSTINNAKLRDKATPDLSKQGQIKKMKTALKVAQTGQTLEDRKAKMAKKLVGVIGRLGYPDIAKELADRISGNVYDTSLGV